MTAAEARLELALALRIIRDGRTWGAASAATGLAPDRLMELEGVWESRRRVMLPVVVQAARGYGVPLEDLLPGTALRSGPVRRWRWPTTLHGPALSRVVQRRLAASGVDLHALFKAETPQIRRRFNRLVEAKPDVFWLARAAATCGTTLAEWLPPEWRPRAEDLAA